MKNTVFECINSPSIYDITQPSTAHSTSKMKGLIQASSAALSLANGILASPVKPRSDIIFFKPLSATTDSVHNVHLGFGDDDFEGEVKVVFGNCDMTGHNEKHHDVASHWIKRSDRPERLVWIVPEDAVHGGCL